MDEEGKIPHSKLYIFLNFFTITASIVIIYIVFVGDNSSNALKSYEAPNTLEFAIIAFRHGARSPVLTFPTDKSEWPDGRLTLTSKGKSQMFKRGQTLRARYGNFFNNTFCQEDFLIRTTNSSRTRMSLEILLSGMFPADPQRPGNWQPVDLQTDNFDKSAIVINPEKCPKYGTEQHDAIQFDNYRENNRDFISFLVKETGLLINDPLDMLVIWDVINCSEETGYILPDWANKNVTNKLFDEIDKMMNSFVASTPRATSFVEGPLIHYFNNWLTLKSSGNATEKILMHSGHDFTLLSLLSAVGFKQISNVPFASVLVFEVHKVHQSRQVKLLFYNSTANYENSEDILVEPIHLDMPSCSGKCTLDNFQSLLSEFEIDENTWQERCHEQ